MDNSLRRAGATADYILISFIVVSFPCHCLQSLQYTPRDLTQAAMAENTDQLFTAQLIMRRADGLSILDLPSPVRADSSALTAGDLPQERVALICNLLERHGFQVTSANANTLSITGTSKSFIATFGLNPQSSSGLQAQPAISIPDFLRPYVADVFIPPSPQFFP